MQSGIALNPECIARYHELKNDHKYRYIIYKIEKFEKTPGKKVEEIVIDKTSPEVDRKRKITLDEKDKKDLRDEYDEFLRSIPEEECRWAVYDFYYEGDKSVRNKLVFLSWAPDAAEVKLKMQAATSKSTVHRALEGIQAEIQAADPSEYTYDQVLGKVLK